LECRTLWIIVAPPLSVPCLIVADMYLAVDPELKAEFEERQKSSAANPAANPLQNFDAAAWLAGSSSSTKRSEPEKAVERGVTR
jgi:hypothetical protein